MLGDPISVVLSDEFRMIFKIPGLVGISEPYLPEYIIGNSVLLCTKTLLIRELCSRLLESRLNFITSYLKKSKGVLS